MKVNSRGIITIVALALCLTACGNNDESDPPPPPPTTTWTPPTSPTPTPTWTLSLPSITPTVRATYQVPDADCPATFHHGLLISTETAAELKYVDKIVACTTDLGTETYLRNESDAVWALHNSLDARYFAWSDNLRIASFRSIFESDHVLLAPKGVITATVPPSALTWSIDLLHSLDWEAHELVADKLEAYGEAALIGGAGRLHPAGKALVQCTLAVHAYGKTIAALADEDLSDVLANALATGVAGNKCRQQGAGIRLSSDPSSSIVLTEELDHLKGQTKFLETFESRWSTAKQGSRVLKFFGLLLRHH
jgi:hypothetical protein